MENGKVKSISGGKIGDIKNDLKSLNYTPNTITTYVGGNDLMDSNKTVESVSMDHTLMLTDIKMQFPESNIAVSGLVPRTETAEVRTKVKDFNRVTKEWCSANAITFIQNEDCFELKSGHVDVSCYNMTEKNPAVHLNRRGTVRLLENINKQVPEMKLSESFYCPESQKSSRTYAETLKGSIHQENGRLHYGGQRKQQQSQEFESIIIVVVTIVERPIMQDQAANMNKN